MQEFIKKIDKIELENALYILATPIGNLKDITIRALEVLKSCNHIFCEDTRVSGNILNVYGIEHEKLGIYNDYSDDRQRELIISLITEHKKSVVLISDAGTPTISDPGYKLLVKCQQNGIKIIPIPGCNACVTAMSASAISTDKFLFYGFLSHNNNLKEKELKELMDRKEAVVLYESPMRLLKTLEIIKSIDSKRTICVAKELTKLFENIFTKSAEDAFLYYSENQDKIRGEFTIIIEKTKEIDNYEKFDLKNINTMLERSLKYMSVKDSAEFFSDAFKLKKSEIYKKLLEFRRNI